MKKLLSMLLAASLLTAAGFPASAASAPAPDSEAPIPDASSDSTAERAAESAEEPSADSIDVRLAAVTRAVKTRLNLGDDFNDFSGRPNENQISPRWNLHWSNETRSVNVAAGEDGKIYSYDDRSEDESGQRFWGLTASFPKADADAALAAAQRFADSLLDEHESVELKSAGTANSEGIPFTGTLCFYGLPSPVSVRVQIRADTLAPYEFWRDDCYASAYPDVPAAENNTTAEEAGKLLRSTLQLTPYYVYTEDRKTAELRYVLETEGNFAVTANDGKLVDLSKVYSDLARSYTANAKAEMSMDAAAPADAGGSASAKLSETELKAVESLRDVHSREQLDAALRAIPALGLSDAWTLERASYSQEPKSGDVFATLRYVRPMTREERQLSGSLDDGDLAQLRKSVTMNARTDELRSVYTARYWDDGRSNTPDESQRAAAEAFLAEYLPGKWKACARYERKNDDRLLYAQSVGGYLFRENLISVRLAADDTVEQLNVSWDDKVQFADADGAISPEEAVDACFRAFEMPLSYIEYPVMEKRLLASRYVAAYAFRQEDDRYFEGIDAKTGEPVWRSYGSADAFSYTDLGDAYGRTQIEALAAYGIGLPGEQFRPKDALDQKTMLALLLSACGYKFDPNDPEGLDNLYAMAYSENLVRAADRSPDAAVSRMTFLKSLLNASAYGEAAKVQGIYTCPFRDRKQIASSDLGYAALAYGLGVARGDDQGRLNPNRGMTRQEAAVMLYNFMMR